MKERAQCGDRPQCCEHVAHLYTDSNILLGKVASFITPALLEGHAAVIAATQEHIDGLLRRINNDQIDVERLLERRQLICVDAEQLLANILDNNQINWESLQTMMEPEIEAATARFGELVVYGEVVNVLWQQGNYAGAHALEQWWNELVKRYGFALMCGYRADLLSYQEDMVDRLHEVCQTHTHVAASGDGERMEAAVDAALSQVLPDSDVRRVRHALIERTRPGLRVSPANAVLLGLHSLLPTLAQEVRMLARDFYQR